MGISKMIKDEKEIDYETLKQIQEHAKKYDESVDKKEFLSGIGAYEQKLVLLNSKKPYEVLRYMEELDLPTTKVILEELNYEEISKILELFTAEDKKNFYTTFSQLALVNQFIVYDKNSSQYIEDLSVDRKIELLNSSDKNTVSATTKVYESMSAKEKTRAVGSIDSVDALSALNGSTSYNESNEVNTNDDSSKEIIEQEQPVEEEQHLEEKAEEEKNEEKELKEVMEEQVLQEKTDYFKENFEKYKEINPELSNLDISNPNILSMLSEAVLIALETDFLQFQREKQNQLENYDRNVSIEDVSKKFKQAQVRCEGELMSNLQNQFVSSANIDIEFEQELLNNQKTL